MDYSAVPGEDHLQGSSPWGSSSPRASRTNFVAPTPDSPEPFRSASDSPPGPIPRSDYPAEQDDTQSGGIGIGAAEQTATPFGGEILGAAAEGSQRQQDGDTKAPDAGYQPGHGPPHQHQHTHQPQQGRPGQGRQPNTRQQRPIPQYKLQAKVTALERSGRKDPILRFDVYVSYMPANLHNANTHDRPTFPSFAPHSFETYVEPIPSFKNLRTISSPRIQKHSYQRSHQASHLLELGRMKMKHVSKHRYRGGLTMFAPTMSS